MPAVLVNSYSLVRFLQLLRSDHTADAGSDNDRSALSVSSNPSFRAIFRRESLIDDTSEFDGMPTFTLARIHVSTLVDNENDIEGRFERADGTPYEGPDYEAAFRGFVKYIDFKCGLDVSTQTEYRGIRYASETELTKYMIFGSAEATARASARLMDLRVEEARRQDATRGSLNDAKRARSLYPSFYTRGYGVTEAEIASTVSSDGARVSAMANASPIITGTELGTNVTILTYRGKRRRDARVDHYFAGANVQPEDSSTVMRSLPLKAEQAMIADYLSSADADEVVFVNGEAGCGKTVLREQIRHGNANCLLMLPTHRMKAQYKCADPSEDTYYPCVTVDSIVVRLMSNQRMSPQTVVNELRDNLDVWVKRVGEESFLNLDQELRPRGTEHLKQAVEEEAPAPPRSSLVPDLWIVDEACLLNWRKLFIIRAAARTAGARLVLFGDTRQNQPIGSEPNNAELIIVRCCDTVFNMIESQRALDPKMREIVQLFNEFEGPRLRDRIARTVGSADTLTRREISLRSMIELWMNTCDEHADARSLATVDFSTLPLTPRVISLSNRNTDRVNRAIQIAFLRAARERWGDRGMARNVRVYRRAVLLRDGQDDEELDMMDDDFCNDILLGRGLTYRYYGSKYPKDTNMTVLEFATEKDGELSLIMKDERGNTLALKPALFEETRISSKWQTRHLYGFPLVLDSAITQFKSQGDTLDPRRWPDVYVDAHGMNDRALYVAMSRVRKFEQFRALINL